MVVTIGEAMLKGFPVPIEVPPQLEVYHPRVVPDPPTTLKLILPASSAQKLFLSLAAETGAIGNGLMVTVTLAQAEFPQAFSQRA